MFDPITVLKAKDEFFSNEEIIPMKSSGVEVATAIIMNPTANSVSLR